PASSRRPRERPGLPELKWGRARAGVLPGRRPRTSFEEPVQKRSFVLFVLFVVALGGPRLLAVPLRRPDLRPDGQPDLQRPGLARRARLRPLRQGPGGGGRSPPAR